MQIHPSQSIDAVIFDCDGTLTQLEGIDYLAELKNVADAVKPITQQAMTHGNLNEQVFQQRLDLIKPTQQDFSQLAQAYYQQRSLDVGLLLQKLQRLGKAIYVLSAGMMPAIQPFAQKLQLDLDKLYCVAISFDEAGNYLDFDHRSPLIHNRGKYAITQEIVKQHQNVAHIGDGANDFVTANLVTRFIGYGGNFYRANLEAKCDFYVREESMLNLLPFLLTGKEYGHSSTLE